MAEQLYSLQGKRVWVAGHRGMLGSAIVRRLAREDCDLLTATRNDLDLRDPGAVGAWIRVKKPVAVFVAAAKVGGIVANDTHPAEFLYDNAMIATNVIHAAYENGVEKLQFVGSSCVYPKFAPQPITEDALLTGALEPTNEWYALAKIVGVKMCAAYRRQYGCDFISSMPTNLYGPGDNYDLQNSHVVPALLRKAHDAKMAGRRTLPIWGTGSPRREFLHVDDCADAIVHLMKTWSAESHVNIGVGDDISILELASIVMRVVGLEGDVDTDPSKPDGTPRKLLDVSKLTELGWRPSIGLEDGLRAVYAGPPFDEAA